MGKRRKELNPVIEVLQASLRVTSDNLGTKEVIEKLSELRRGIIEQANESYPTKMRSRLFETVQSVSMTTEQQMNYFSYQKPKMMPYTKPEVVEITIKMKIYEEEL